jgi:predicted acyltransferase
MWKHDYDPEGIVSTIPAIISCLMGILAAKIFESKKKLLPLFGLILLMLGYIFNQWFPINKSLWTSSFVLVSSGWCYMLLFFIDLIFKLKHFKFLTIFLHTGMNAILIYVFSYIMTILFYAIQIENTGLHTYLFENLVSLSQLSEKNASLLYGIVVTSFYLTVGYVLFRKRIFIKI